MLDATYDDLWSHYLSLSSEYSKAVDDLTFFLRHGRHEAFLQARPLARRLAGKVEIARTAALAQRLLR